MKDTLAWYHNERAQARYRSLIETEERLKGNAASEDAAGVTPSPAPRQDPRLMHAFGMRRILGR